MPVSGPYAFKPAVAPIALGAAGTVLTSNGASAATPPTFQPAGSGGSPNAGAAIAATLAAGATNNLNPGAGWPASFGRLLLNSSAGAANITGLVAGTDGQTIEICNNLTGATNVTLNSQNAGSTAANQFVYVGDFALPSGASIRATYYASSTGVNGGAGGWVLNV